MIKFIAPASSAFFSVDTEYTVDINMPINKQVTMMENLSKDFPLEQARADGHNAVRENISFNIINLPIAEIQALDNYFNEIKGTTPIDMIFPGSNSVTAGVAGANGLTVGKRYRILVAGTMNWPFLGAGSYDVGAIFNYNGVTSTGSGGSVENVIKRILIQNWDTSIPNDKFGAISASGRMVRI